MIDYISIKNFRCFHNTQIKGFGNINLIGGLNNSGKTALLEALLLAFSPTLNSLTLLRKFRGEGFNREMNENIWQYFFLDKDDSQKIEIQLQENKAITYDLIIDCNRDIGSIDTSNNNKDRLAQIFREATNTFFLNIKGVNNTKEFDYFPIMIEMNTGLQMRIIDRARAIGNLPNAIDIITPFLHSFLRKTDSELTKLYTKAKSHKAELLGFLTLLDKRINDIEILTPNEDPILYLTLQDGKSFPINMFGDAVRKVVEILLVILNTSNSILLIDEIENGVHYTKQKDLWRILFEISERQKVQFFATTHSREMITAFANVANTKIDISATYFQMYRSGLSGEIVAAPYYIEELLYALNNNIALRGETEI